MKLSDDYSMLVTAFGDDGADVVITGASAGVDADAGVDVDVDVDAGAGTGGNWLSKVAQVVSTMVETLTFYYF